MSTYILQRMILFVPTAIGVSIFIFAMLHIIPGDRATTILLGGRDRSIEATEEDFRRVREQLGLTGSWPQQYARWAGDFLRGDFGTSWSNSKPVLERMLPRIAMSFELGLLAVLLSVLIAIPGGIIAAVRQDTKVDYALRFFSMLLESMPGFWVALLIIVGLLWAFDWIPPIEYKQFWEDPWANVVALFFPALAVGSRASANLLRMTRSSVLEVLREDYIRTAEAKGLRRPTVLYVHVLRNALLPVTTLAGFEVVGLLGGVIVTEQVFNLPGLGKLFVQAVAARDYPVIQAIVMFSAALVLAANLLVDMMYAWLDPRIRYD